MLVSEKNILRSKTIWGTVIAAAPAVDKILFALGVSPIPVVGELVGAATTLFGAALAFFGRVKAVAKIK